MEFDVSYVRHRNPLSTAIRLFVTFPHPIVCVLALAGAIVASTMQWFTCVITGRRNAKLWAFTYRCIGFAARVYSFGGLLHDTAPSIGMTEATPLQYSIVYDEHANRLTVGLRLICIVPAAVVGVPLLLAALLVTALSWFAIILTGIHPKWMFAFLLRSHRFLFRFLSYEYLLTDKYPSMP